MRIVSYNVRYFGHALRGLASTRGPKRRIATSLAALDPLPDIVCLQEVETRSMRSRLAYSADEDETQLEAFMGELEQAFARSGHASPYEAFYFRAHSYTVGNLPIYTTGLAILVNLVTLRVGAHNVQAPEHITHHHIARWKDRKQSRICAHLRLRTPEGTRFHIFNTHLSLPTPFARGFWREGDKMGFGVNQVHEAHTLAGFIDRHAGGEPYIVCGDFNSFPGSPVYRYLTERAGLVSAQERLGVSDPAHPRAYPTAGFFRMRMHLDHLFGSRAIEWLDLSGTCPFGDRTSPFHGCSDHMPLVGKFRLAA